MIDHSVGAVAPTVGPPARARASYTPADWRRPTHSAGTGSRGAAHTSQHHAINVHVEQHQEAGTFFAVRTWNQQALLRRKSPCCLM